MKGLASVKLMSCSIHALIIIFLGSRANGQKTGEYDFRLLIMVWMPSYCNTPSSKCEDIKNIFFIESLCPMYDPHEIVRPYNETGCQLIDEPVDKINLENFEPQLLDVINEIWPSYEKTLEDHLQDNWDTYGKCYMFPKQPERYFAEGIHIAKVRLTLPLIRFIDRIFDSRTTEEGISLTRIRNAANEYILNFVQIICNKDISGRVQFFKLGVCYRKRYDKKQDCDIAVDNDHTCKDAPNGNVVFPSASITI